MKRILVLVNQTVYDPKGLNWFGLRDLLRSGLKGEAIVEMAAYTQLTFVLNGDEARIFDARQNFDVRDFDLVIFRTVGKELDPAIAVAAYCRKLGIPYIDPYVPHAGGRGKLACGFIRWEHGLGASAPITLLGPNESVLAEVEKGYLGWPLIVKADIGKKGRDNYLVRDVAELRGVLDHQPSVKFVLQSFIPNDGDYRMLTMNGKVRMAILRTAKAGSHLNNTSQGGSAEDVPLSQVPQAAIDLAVAATEAEQLSIAGTDIVIDKNTGKPYVLEVNRAPQIPTGVFADKKMDAYVTAIKELL